MTRFITGCALPVVLPVVLPLFLLTGCAGPASSLRTPLAATPIAPPPNVERMPTGAIFQPNVTMVSFFASEKRPRAIGDTLKIDIAETLSATNKSSTDTTRENKVATKGPGTGSGGGVLKALWNLDASASGSDAFKGNGSTESSSSFNGRLAATVINVLPNGNLVVAGERSIAFNQGTTTLRFSGIVNPTDIRPGNVIASSDVVDAKLEAVGKGGVADTEARSWLQRVLTGGMTVW